MSLSSFGNFSMSGAATLRVPDCSSALGLYVPSVCLFFFTTQKSQPRTAKTMARTPRVTVGATIAAMFGPCRQKNASGGLLKLDTSWCDLFNMIKVFFTHISVIRLGHTCNSGKISWKKDQKHQEHCGDNVYHLVQCKSIKPIYATFKWI